MILRNEFKIQGFMDKKLDNIEKIKNIKEQNTLLPYPEAAIENFVPHFIPKSTYQENFDLDIQQNKEQQVYNIQQNQLLLNKFEDLMKKALQDNKSYSNSEIDKQSIQSKQSLEINCQNQDKFSQFSISESKFGDLLMKNPTLKFNDIKRLIKDNFGYFKHLFGYCICIKCPCGFCKCEYIKKDQKRIKFRGGFISLYTQQFQQKENEQNLKYYNKNLNRVLFSQKLDNMYDNPDKINNKIQEKIVFNNVPKPIQKFHEAPFQSLTTNQLNYKNYQQQHVTKPFIPKDQYQQQSQFNQQFETIYKQQFLGRTQSKQQKCQFQNNINFPQLPMQKSSYSKDYLAPQQGLEQIFGFKQKSTLTSDNIQGCPFKTTSGDAFKKNKLQYCVEEEPQHQIKKDMLQKIQFMMLERQDE